MVTNTSDDTTITDVKKYAASIKFFYQKLLAFIIAAVKKNWYLLLLGIALGAGIAYYKFKQSKPYFEGRASFTFSDFNKKIYGEMADQLKALCNSGSYKILAEKMNMSEADAAKIADIDGENIAGSRLSDDITETKQPFYIHVKLHDRQIADSLPVKLENYFNNNPQVKAMIITNLGKMKARLVYSNDQLHRLDSLKSVYQFYLAHQTAGSASIINTFNPVDLFTASEKLFIAKTDMEWGIATYRVVKIFNPFVINAYPVSVSLRSLLIRYCTIGLLLAFILSLLLFTLKKI
jgi:hypothetical protein